MNDCKHLDEQIYLQFKTLNRRELVALLFVLDENFSELKELIDKKVDELD